MSGVKGMQAVYRECPYCGQEVARMMYHVHAKHDSHISKGEVLLKMNNMSEIPKCVICGKPCSTRGYTFNSICGSRYCKEQLKVKLGTHPLQRQNSAKDSEGKLIRCINSNKSALANGNHSSQKPKVDPSKISKLYIMQFSDFIKVGKTRDLKSRLLHLGQCGYVPSEIIYWEDFDDKISSIEHEVHSKGFKRYLNIKDTSAGFHSIGFTEFYQSSEFSVIMKFIQERFNDYYVGVSAPKCRTVNTEDIV